MGKNVYSKDDLRKIIDYEEKSGKIHTISNVEKSIICSMYIEKVSNSDALLSVENESDAAYSICDDILDELLIPYRNKKII